MKSASTPSPSLRWQDSRQLPRPPQLQTIPIGNIISAMTTRALRRNWDRVRSSSSTT